MVVVVDVAAADTVVVIAAGFLRILKGSSRTLEGFFSDFLPRRALPP